MQKRTDVVIIGAGPYGLSAAAHLGAIGGLDVKVFGEPMEFWRNNMPAGMLLRSPWEASHIADPGNKLSLESYLAVRKKPISRPIPLETFVEYGQWFQKQAAPELDRRKISRVESEANGFRLTVQDGEVVTARRVVVATGIAPFARRPAEFAGLPDSLVSHACDHSKLAKFNGKRVAVVGAGQSALESAAILHESGAKVEIIVREPHIRWLKWRSKLFRLGVIGRILYSPRDVGPAGISQLVARPDLFCKLPRGFQDKVGRRAIKPAGSAWLMDRLKDVPVRTGRHAKSGTPTPAGGGLRLTLDDGSDMTVDHVLFGTGYQIDIAKYPFLDAKLLEQISRFGGYPRLGPGLESSVPGLHFLGAPAAWSFGPVARFVSGTYYCVQALTDRIAKAQ
jgi:thioredoxin reductase